MKLDPDFLKVALAQGATLGPLPKAPGTSAEPTAKGKRPLLPASFQSEDDGTLCWVVPLYISCGDNDRGMKRKIGRGGHERRTVHRTLAQQYGAMAWAVSRVLRGKPVTITLTRLGPRVMDHMNVVAAMKYVVDSLADRFGVDDGSPLFHWQYAQEKSPAYGVRIEITEGGK